MNNWANRLGFRKPNNKIEWAIWIGAGFMFSAIICSLLFVKKLQEIPPQTLTALYITHFLKDIGFGVIAAAILLGGLYRLKYDENKKKGYLATIGGVLLFLSMIGKPAISSIMLSNIQTNIQTNTTNFSKLLIEKQSRADLSVKGKAHFRKAVAQEKFFQDGATVEYVDENGNTVKYQPTEKDLQMREAHLYLLSTTRMLRIEMIFWTTVFIATITGFVIFYKQKDRSFNQNAREGR